MIGLIAGALLGLLIGVNVVGETPTEQPSADGQREFLRKAQVGYNSVTKTLGGTIGAVLGGIVGTAAGAGIGAALATKSAVKVDVPE